MWNIEKRLRTMDSLGIDLQVLSIGNPLLSYVPRHKHKSAARALNTELASISRENPKRFAAMGVVPLSSMNDAVEEIDYAINELGIKGFMIGTHQEGIPMFSEEFFPCFEEIERRGTPVFMHPIARDVGNTTDRLITVGLLFPYETTVTATGFMTSGLMDKVPNLKLILAHLGGNIPYSVGRIDRAVKTNPTRAKLSRTTLDYLKQFYLDSVVYFGPALEFAIDVWGPNKVLLGSDFPWHWSTDYEKVLAPVEKSKYETGIKEMIYGENAISLFKI